MYMYIYFFLIPTSTWNKLVSSKRKSTFELIYTFKLAHKLVAWLWVEAGADEGEDGQLLHLLFVCCRNMKKTRTVSHMKTTKQQTLSHMNAFG